MSRTYPEGFDDDDKAFADALIPDNAFISELIAVTAWMNEEGEYCWRCYIAGGERVGQTLGLLELAKLDVIARSDTGLPIQYITPDEDTEP